MPEGSRAGRRLAFGIIWWCSLLAPGCATMRLHAPLVDLRPCADGFATTDDGWKLGIRRFRPCAAPTLASCRSSSATASG